MGGWAGEALEHVFEGLHVVGVVGFNGCVKECDGVALVPVEGCGEVLAGEVTSDTRRDHFVGHNGSLSVLTVPRSRRRTGKGDPLVEKDLMGLSFASGSFVRQSIKGRGQCPSHAGLLSDVQDSDCLYHAAQRPWSIALVFEIEDETRRTHWCTKPSRIWSFWCSTRHPFHCPLPIFQLSTTPAQPPWRSALQQRRRKHGSLPSRR